MKKGLVVWQLIVLVVSLLAILIINSYLKSKIIVEVAQTQAETYKDRANCFAVAQDKSLDNSYCKDIDITSDFSNLQKIKFVPPL